MVIQRRNQQFTIPDSKSNPIQSIEFTMVAEKMVDGGKNISIRGYLLMAQQALEQRDNNGFSLRIWSLLQRWRWWGWLRLELAAFLFFFPPCGRDFWPDPCFIFVPPCFLGQLLSPSDGSRWQNIKPAPTNKKITDLLQKFYIVVKMIRELQIFAPRCLWQ